MSDAELLEQQMILQAIAESNKLACKSKPEPKPTNDEQQQPAQPKPAQAVDANTKTSESKSTKSVVDKDVQSVSDAMLAMRLQQQEQRELTRRVCATRVFFDFDCDIAIVIVLRRKS